MRSHRAGHHQPIEETLAELALNHGLLQTDSGFNAGPVGPLATVQGAIVSEANTVTVSNGQFVIIDTTVEYDAAVSELGGSTVTQEILDQLAHSWDSARQWLEPDGNDKQVVGRSIRLGPVGAVGQPAAGTYKFTVSAAVASAATSPVTAFSASIVVEVVNV